MRILVECKDTLGRTKILTIMDDRAYCLAMLGYYLSEKRLEHIKNKKRNIGTSELVNLLPIKSGVGMRV